VAPRRRTGCDLDLLPHRNLDVILRAPTEIGDHGAAERLYRRKPRHGNPGLGVVPVLDVIGVEGTQFSGCAPVAAEKILKFDQ
jgi:hypothetical protein